MKITNFIGVDISKKTLDFALVIKGSVSQNFKIQNSKKDLNSFFKDFRIDFSETLFCMEHTGIYGNILLDYLYQKQALIWLESAIQIKRSQGILRGKNDKVDAQRIALYAFKNHSDARLWKPEREVIVQLKYLQQTRERLIQAIQLIEKPINEAKGFIKQKYIVSMGKACRSSIRTLKKELNNIDQQIMDIIVADENLTRLFNIIISVDGIGKVTATQIIITTNEFKDFSNAKKYACYAGVVPFEHTSGTSIKGKTRVSHFANKNIKRLLHMAALVVISKPGELQNYYHRKIEEGKNKMLIINAIRNKLILRIFACVLENRLYEKKYQYQVV